MTLPLSKYDRLAIVERRLSATDNAVKRTIETFGPVHRSIVEQPSLVPFAQAALKEARVAQDKLLQAIQWIESLIENPDEHT